MGCCFIDKVTLEQEKHAIALTPVDRKNLITSSENIKKIHRTFFISIDKNQESYKGIMLKY